MAHANGAEQVAGISSAANARRGRGRREVSACICCGLLLHTAGPGRAFRASPPHSRSARCVRVSCCRSTCALALRAQTLAAAQSVITMDPKMEPQSVRCRPSSPLLCRTLTRVTWFARSRIRQSPSSSARSPAPLLRCSLAARRSPSTQAGRCGGCGVVRPASRQVRNIAAGQPRSLPIAANAPRPPSVDGGDSDGDSAHHLAAPRGASRGRAPSASTVDADDLEARLSALVEERDEAVSRAHEMEAAHAAELDQVRTRAGGGARPGRGAAGQPWMHEALIWAMCVCFEKLHFRCHCSGLRSRWPNAARVRLCVRVRAQLNSEKEELVAFCGDLEQQLASLKTFVEQHVTAAMDAQRNEVPTAQARPLPAQRMAAAPLGRAVCTLASGRSCAMRPWLHSARFRRGCRRSRPRIKRRRC
jgi:hypothetical protein